MGYSVQSTSSLNKSPKSVENNNVVIFDKSARIDDSYDECLIWGAPLSKAIQTYDTIEIQLIMMFL